MTYSDDCRDKAAHAIGLLGRWSGTFDPAALDQARLAVEELATGVPPFPRYQRASVDELATAAALLARVAAIQPVSPNTLRAAALALAEAAAVAERGA